METETIKTILISIGVIEKSREVLVDVLEKVEKFHMDELSENGRFDIHGLDIFCKRMKNDLFCADSNTENMKEQISAEDETEITEAVLRVEDILIDDLSLPKPIPNPSSIAGHMANEAIGAARRIDNIRLAQIRAGEKEVVDNLKKSGF